MPTTHAVHEEMPVMSCNWNGGAQCAGQMGLSNLKITLTDAQQLSTSHTIDLNRRKM